MLIPEYSSIFKKDLKIIKKRNRDLEQLKDIISLLYTEEQLHEKNKQHNLFDI